LKDHLSDEPDSMDIRYIIPSHLKIASNGRLTDSLELDNNRMLWHFKVQCPINSYNVTFYLGDYLPFRDRYKGKAGNLDLKYYFLKDQFDRKVRFFKRETPKMLKAFEHYFGPYPCYSDGYGLAEAPYWGMEHQGMIAYGNHLKLLPKYKFDFILVHESGHEWFGNSVSCDDHAEMWIHEGFTTYSEALYVEYYQGYLKSLAYLTEQRQRIEGKYPILSMRDINYQQKDADIYYKGTWFIHTLRHVIQNDKIWFHAILSFSQNFRHRVIKTEDVLGHFQKFTDVPLTPIFNQYLKYTSIPELEFYHDADGIFQSRWLRVELDDFHMPVYGSKGNRLDPHGVSQGKFVVRQRDIDFVRSRYLIDIRITKSRKD
jgi:aminopeptidase N